MRCTAWHLAAGGPGMHGCVPGPSTFGRGPRPASGADRGGATRQPPVQADWINPVGLFVSGAEDDGDATVVTLGPALSPLAVRRAAIAEAIPGVGDVAAAALAGREQVRVALPGNRRRRRRGGLPLLPQGVGADVLADVVVVGVVRALARHAVDQVADLRVTAGRGPAEGGAGLEAAPRLLEHEARPGADLIDQCSGTGVARRVGRNGD